MVNLEYNSIFAITLTLFIIMMVKGEMNFDNEEVRDITKDFTDNDLKLALNDLSLKDLKTLQKFIDSIDYKEDEFQENSFIDQNPETLNNNDFAKEEEEEYEIIDYNPQQNGCNCNCKPQKNINDLIYYTNSQEQTQRTKRQEQKNNINEDYIKQLAYSFPQNEQQDQDERESSHETLIRVKRN